MLSYLTNNNNNKLELFRIFFSFPNRYYGLDLNCFIFVFVTFQLNYFDIIIKGKNFFI